MPSQPPSGSGSQRDHKLLSILEISQKMNAERDPSALLELIAREATRLMEADRASIFLLDRQHYELLSGVALGSEEGLRFDARLGIAGAAVMTGETINVQNAQEDPRFYPQIDSGSGYTTHSVLVVPMRNEKAEVIGVFEVLNKRGGPFGEPDEQILRALAVHAAIAIETAQLFRELQQENSQLKRAIKVRSATRNIRGTSPQIQKIVRLIDTVGDSNVSVLITGESGTGKELVARAIHGSSPRAGGPFVALNSAALPENLLESELFGIERGVATGVEKRTGKFEEATGGTLFLDEIGDLSLSAQAKILRALQEKIIEPVGGRKGKPVDVRILAATHKNLAEAIESGEFREDLYYRLNVVHIDMPPLREIKEDIPILVLHFLSHQCREMGKELKTMTDEALTLLREHSWPGNVRQLENEIKRLVVSVRGRVIRVGDLSVSTLPTNESTSTSGQKQLSRTMKDVVADTVARIEKKMMLEALEDSSQNQQRAARALGLSRQGFIKKMKRYGLK